MAWDVTNGIRARNRIDKGLDISSVRRILKIVSPDMDKAEDICYDFLEMLQTVADHKKQIEYSATDNEQFP